MNPISLFELNNLVRTTLENTWCDPVWIAAELSELRRNPNGHCYLELVEKDSRSDALIAKARGNIWRNVWPLLKSHFEKVTGRTLAPGMRVLVAAEVTFHELYGYSLNIVDIDPTYTLGDMSRRRNEILAQLKADGVYTLNKELTLPRPLKRIAVISSPTAAGYGDFCNQLEQSGCAFRLEIYPATMQGEQVGPSIIAALDRIASEEHLWDAVAIIRGGGASSDLNGFDNYDLASHIAQFPLPVFTGIGHERDDTVIDFVAHTRFKTPTAVAAFLIQQDMEETRICTELQRRLQQSVCVLLEQEQNRLREWMQRYKMGIWQSTRSYHEILLRKSSRMQIAVGHQLQDARFRLETCPPIIRQASERLLETHRQRHLHITQIIGMTDPQHILRLGFSITRYQGKSVQQPNDVPIGATITTQLAEGEITSTVQTHSQTKKNEKEEPNLRTSTTPA